MTTNLNSRQRKSPMDGFGTYVDQLEGMVAQLVNQQCNSSSSAAVVAALNGGPAKELRRLVPIRQLRRHGAFFTGSKLAFRAVGGTLGRLSRSSMIGDFTCGAGDLLVACAAKLPIASSLTETVFDWGNRLVGRDLQPEFVRATKARLALAAIERGALSRADKRLRIADVFPNIRVGCGRTDIPSLRQCSHLVLNPPFTKVEAPDRCEWTSGSVNAAALFVETCLRHARVGTRLMAILPEVLRCGARYHTWRALVEKLARVTRIEPVGQFDEWTDVDVFIMEAEVRSSDRTGGQSADWGYAIKKGDSRCVGDFFDVSVGPIVPFRTRNRGPWMPFLCPDTLPAWVIVDRTTRKIRYAGEGATTPLVVVRRTSRLSDKKRAVGTIITVTSPIAIENHLVVLRPRDGQLATCKQLLKVLQATETDMWLNQRIRCRHLTVSAVRDLPWLSDHR